MKIYFKTRVQENFKLIKAGFNQELFGALTPPWAKVEQSRFDGCQEGDEIHLTIKQFPLKLKWVSLITYEGESVGEWSFIDQGKTLPFPLTHWRHLHRVVRVSENKSEIIDDIEYKCYNQTLEKLIFPALWATMAIRPTRYRKYFEKKK